MKVETFPLILGALVGLIGLGLLADAWLPEHARFRSERRRRARAERSLGGESAIGLGVLCIAAALMGRDSWPYSTVSVIAGSVLLLWGAWLNRTYFRERITNRGELRRGDPPEPPKPQ